MARKYGDRHHRVKIPDSDIPIIRQLNDEGVGYKRLAEKWECGVSTIRDICTYRTRYNV